MNKQIRLDWIDLTKGLAIFLMVCGHTSIPIFASKFIWSFHIPLFYIISGMLFNETHYRNFALFLKKRIKTILIPYICFTVIVITVDFIHNVNFEWRYNTGWGGYALWFIEVLFTTEILMFYVFKYIKRHFFLIMCISILFIGGYILHFLNIKLPFKQDVVLWASTFYGIGHILKDWLKKIKVKWFIAIGMITIAFILCQLFPKTDMCENNYGYKFFNSILALWGTVSIILLSKSWFPEFISPIRKFFIWSGRNTLIIMGLSEIIIAETKDYFTSIPIPTIANSLLRHLLMWILIFFLSSFINKYLPFIVGKDYISNKK